MSVLLVPLICLFLMSIGVIVSFAYQMWRYANEDNPRGW